MHGQLHFRAANSDLRGCAGVLRLLLFNSGEGSPVNFQRIYRRRFEKKEKRQWAINIVRIIVHTRLIESLNLERITLRLIHRKWRKSSCVRGDRNFDVASLGGKSRGGGGRVWKNTGFQVDHMAVIMVAHSERTARFQRERFQGPAQRVALNTTVPTTRLDGQFPCYFLYGSFNDLRNILPSPKN